MNREAELEQVRTQISALKVQELTILESIRHDIAMEWIKANDVTIDQVHRSDLPVGGTMFMVSDDFVKWVESLPVQKRFCEWNYDIYFKDDLKARRWEAAKAKLKDLQK